MKLVPSMAWVTKASPSRLIELDILRGIAILLVIGRHSVLLPEQAGIMAHFAGFWMRFGWTGVDLFFVLSGFLIGSQLFAEIAQTGSLDVGRFWTRRAFKILPASVVFLIYLFVGLSVKSGSPLHALGQVWPILLHVQNYFPSPRLHLWALSLEEHFYLFLPLVLSVGLCVRTKGTREIPLVPLLSLALMIGCLAARYLVGANRPFDYFTRVFPSHLRFDGLFFGVFLAYARQYHSAWLAWIPRHRFLVLAAAALLLCPPLFWELEESSFVQTVGLTMLYLGYSGLLLVMIMKPENPGFFRKALQGFPGRMVAFIGYYSYSIYLWHMDFGYRFANGLYSRGLINGFSPGWQYVVTMLVCIVCAVISGVILATLIEMPALTLRNKIFPDRGGSAGNKPVIGGELDAQQPALPGRQIPGRSLDGPARRPAG